MLIKNYLNQDMYELDLNGRPSSGYPTSQWTDKEGKVHQKYGQDRLWFEENVNFIKLPKYKGSEYYNRGVNRGGINS